MSKALISIIGWQVEGLTEGAVYQFQVYAANLAGLGPASKHSADFTCEVWTMPEPGECEPLATDTERLQTDRKLHVAHHPIDGLL